MAINGNLLYDGLRSVLARQRSYCQITQVPPEHNWYDPSIIVPFGVGKLIFARDNQQGFIVNILFLAIHCRFMTKERSLSAGLGAT